MSKLLDKIKKQSEAPSVQMGFRRTPAAASTPTILLIAGISADGPTGNIKKIDGADALLINIASPEQPAKNLQKITASLGDIPWGMNLEESDIVAEGLAEAGCDFVVFSPASPVSGAPKDEKTGKIIQVESTLDDGLITTLNDLPVDAVIATDIYGEAGALSYHQLMLIRYLAFLVRKPLIVPVPASVSGDELKALWDAGVEAVLVPVDVSKDENLKELKAIAVKLPPRKADKQKKNILLPRMEEKAAPPPDEDDDDE